MYPNGYINIDGTGIDLDSSSSVTISGLNAKIHNAISSGKPIYLYGIVSGTTKYTPIHSVAYSDTSGIGYLLILDSIVKVTSADAVTIES